MFISQVKTSQNSIQNQRSASILVLTKRVKGYKLWDPVAQKVVINRDVVFDEKSMTKAFKEEKFQVVESSNNIGRSTEVELDEFESQIVEKCHSNDQAHDSTRSNRPKRNKRPSVRFGFEDLVLCSTYQ